MSGYVKGYVSYNTYFHQNIAPFVCKCKKFLTDEFPNEMNNVRPQNVTRREVFVWVIGGIHEVYLRSLRSRFSHVKFGSRNGTL